MGNLCRAELAQNPWPAPLLFCDCRFGRLTLGLRPFSLLEHSQWCETCSCDKPLCVTLAILSDTHWVSTIVFTSFLSSDKLYFHTQPRLNALWVSSKFRAYSWISRLQGSMCIRSPHRSIKIIVDSKSFPKMCFSCCQLYTIVLMWPRIIVNKLVLYRVFLKHPLKSLKQNDGHMTGNPLTLWFGSWEFIRMLRL